jgi:hypothetical protein
MVLIDVAGFFWKDDGSSYAELIKGSVSFLPVWNLVVWKFLHECMPLYVPNFKILFSYKTLYSVA